MEDDDEPKKSNKEEEIFGFPISRLGALLGAGAVLGVIALGAHVLKPQLPNLMPQQQVAQQQQQIAQQQQQIAQEQQQIAQAPPEQPAPVAYGYATEHDPMSGKVTRTRVREIESGEGNPDRFSSISV